MPSPEKFRQTLDEFHAEQDLIDEMYQGFGKMESKTNKKIKSAFFTQALAVMNHQLPPEKVQEIFEANACCKSGVREKNSKEFARINSGLDTSDRLKLADIVSTPHDTDGDKPCAFRYEILNTEK